MQKSQSRKDVFSALLHSILLLQNLRRGEARNLLRSVQALTLLLSLGSIFAPQTDEFGLR